MHTNEMVNVKSRYKILYEVDLNQIVKYEKKNETLGKVLKQAHFKECSLFLAIEYGSGINKEDVYIVINPRVRF